MAKGQKRSGREPKKSDAERLKASTTAAGTQLARMGGKDAPKKT